MNSKQGTRYIKKRMGNDLRRQILIQNGIILEEIEMQKKPSILNCPRCSLVNAVDNTYCSKCSYLLIPSAFDEIKEAENMKILAIEKKYNQDMKAMRKELEPLLELKATLLKEGILLQEDKSL